MTQTFISDYICLFAYIESHFTFEIDGLVIKYFACFNDYSVLTLWYCENTFKVLKVVVKLPGMIVWLFMNSSKMGLLKLISGH